MVKNPLVTDVRATGDYRLFLRFEDGLTGEIDLSGVLWGPAFEKLLDPAYFAKVRLDKDRGTVVWPNGTDLAPEMLYARVRASAAA